MEDELKWVGMEAGRWELIMLIKLSGSEEGGGRGAGGSGQIQGGLDKDGLLVACGGGVWERDEARMSLRFLAETSRRRVRSSS